MATRTQRQLRHTLALILLAALPAAAPGDVTYKYTDSDGTPLFTDRPPNSAQVREHEFVGYHGRPPARASCVGVDSEQMRRRANRIDAPLQRAAAETGVDLQLLRAIIAVESCFDPEAISTVGATGLMQLMPETARELGVTDPFNIEDNIRGGTTYFSRMREQFDGDTVRALAAYNAGPTAVERHGGIPPFPETQSYVERVLDHWHIYRDAGFSGQTD